MDSRYEQLNKLQSFIKDVDKEVTLILQNLQWERKHIIKSKTLVNCKYDNNHKIHEDKIESHHNECSLKTQGYSKDEMLPDPPDMNAKTLVKFSDSDITQIIKNAAKNDPSFRKGVLSECRLALSLPRLQCVLTSDERRALHDAAVRAAPKVHDLADLALPSKLSANGRSEGELSRAQILSELRDTRRRRTRYRVPLTRNYSDELRELIASQMELLTPMQKITETDLPNTSSVSKDKRQRYHSECRHASKIESDSAQNYNIALMSTKQKVDNNERMRTIKDDYKYEISYKDKRFLSDSDRYLKDKRDQYNKFRNHDEREWTRKDIYESNRESKKETYDVSKRGSRGKWEDKNVNISISEREDRNSKRDKGARGTASEKQSKNETEDKCERKGRGERSNKTNIPKDKSSFIEDKYDNKYLDRDRKRHYGDSRYDYEKDRDGQYNSKRRKDKNYAT